MHGITKLVLQWNLRIKDTFIGSGEPLSIIGRVSVSQGVHYVRFHCTYFNSQLLKFSYMYIIMYYRALRYVRALISSS